MAQRKKSKRLIEADVTFTIEIQPEDIPVRGNATASGDDAYDRKLEDEIISRLESGHTEAWCYLRVVGKYSLPDGTEFEAVNGLGCCSFLPDETIHKSTRAQIAEQVDDYGMKEEVLTDLQKQVEAHRERQRPVTFRSESRQATKSDLVDIARALGLPSYDAMRVTHVREAIRNQLTVLKMTGKIVPFDGKPR